MKFLRDAKELPTKPSLSQFWEILCSYDWYFQYVDDFSVWKRGAESEKVVKEMARQSDQHQAVYDAHLAYNFGGSSFGTNRPDEPQKSDFNI